MTGKATLPGLGINGEDLIAGGKMMSVFDHLAELRTRLVKSLAWITVIFIICFSFADDIMNYLKGPLAVSLPSNANALHFTGPLDVFMVNMKVAFLASIVMSSPIWLYQFWKFFEPALYPRERKYILPFSAISVVLFLSGVAFCFYVILPMSMTWMIDLGREVGTPMITVTDYVSLIMVMIFGFGVVFETPVLLVLLALLDVVSAEDLAQHRRLVIVIILIVAAILTPPDPISQICLSIPMYAMYEAAIVVIRFIKKRQKVRTTKIGAA